MKSLKNSFFALLLLTGNAVATVPPSVDFLEGIYLYNRAEYDSVIYVFFPDFVKTHPNEEGVARYFLAESYYNKALFETDRDLAIEFLTRAKQAFQRAVKSADLPELFPEFHEFAQYKVGWCSFRLAELGINASQNLNMAYNEFLKMESGALDSLKIYANFMAAESRVLLNLMRVYDLLDQKLNPEGANQLFRSFQTPLTLYDQILKQPLASSAPPNLNELQALTRIKRELLSFHLGDFYLKLPLEHLKQIRDPDKKATLKKTATGYFEKATFENLFQNDALFTERFASTLSYLNMMKNLKLYFINQDNNTKKRFMDDWSRLLSSGLKPELWLRRANLQQSDPDIDGSEFNRLAEISYDSSAQISESFYWLGFLQMIRGDTEKSRKNLVHFLELIPDSTQLSTRERILVEDAKYRKYLLDFELYYFSNEPHALKQLDKELQKFVPQNMKIYDRAQQLYLLINTAIISDPSQLWSKVLSGSDEQKLKQALKTIRFVLPRAALNIGTVREKYLTLLTRLFEITKTRHQNETRFFTGIVQSLEAEIQATPDEKIKGFKRAATTLNLIEDGFLSKTEGDYVRGRSLFFAEEFENSETVLRDLVKDHRHLRSLFYLAEIFRLTDHGLAAQQCYKIIIGKLQNLDAEYADFWLTNAHAGLQSSDDSGNLDIISGLGIEKVIFQPALDPELLTYEKLAEERFLVHQYAREGIDWIATFGLPLKSIFPSKHRIANSTFMANGFVFEGAEGMIDEIRAPVKASLSLRVLLPPGLDGSVTSVLFDGDLLTGGPTFSKHSIALNSTHKIMVDNSDCYEFNLTHRFSNPGENQLVLPLSQKLVYRKTGRTRDLRNDKNYPFSSREDANTVLNPLPALDIGSGLSIDFSHYSELRDIAYDAVGNRILVVNADKNEIWVYSNEPGSQRIGTIDIPANYLDSPEGIASDSKGNIYLSDWGNHRIVILTNENDFVGTLGSFGTNSNVSPGEPIQLTFPTRLALLEDREGIQKEMTYHRASYLYIADFYGIHICGIDGTYQGTLIPPDNDFQEGAFYGLHVQGYGKGSSLEVTGSPRKFQDKIFQFIAK